jgi:HD-like signal output (HDOD) protein
LCDAGADGDEISLCIERDSIICAQVLRIANSPYYGQQRSVSTVRHALLVLGLNAVRGIAAAACVAQMTPKQVPALKDSAAMLRHSLTTAIASELLAASRVPALIPQAFMAGLLHNLGTLVQAVVDTAGVARIIAARRTDDREIRQLERELVSIGHEEAAAIVFEAWQLPDSLIAAASHHHQPADAPEAHRTLVSLVAVAADVALACGSTFALEPVEQPAPRNRSETATLNLSEAEFAGFREQVRQQLTRFGPLLG